MEIFTNDGIVLVFLFYFSNKNGLLLVVGRYRR